MVKIIHQRKKCIGCGACAIACPKFFEIDKKDGLANLKNSKKIKNDFEIAIKDKNTNCAKKAVDICPVRIIKIRQ
ncbi:MAG: ferredoxin [Candidatus Nealsonbacteria bacterium CG_4_9_14_0_8_um_filter_35_12]|uniref:Ferredoxin n=1 Tax=Candidatus Nealsonbacteria bacterium CG_4_9_14_0_8_um_filter_35_12 TaxID=1974692 RepID=A0A2M8DMS8_9BACT|nr:MAG: ferredoxin [Candidatus Nealsonbacteria bacterium CG_4_9_14_0_8_um_filter_35_12]